MRPIVGLGNPGTRYRDTPHNAGFQVCDRFAERHHLGDEFRKFQGLFRRGRVRGEDIGVLKPQTYMSRSGESVGEAVRYLPIEGEDVILVFDEIDLPAGKIRIRPGGGAGGHRGPLSVIEHLATRQFPRIRLGVGRPERQRDPTGHLLTALKGEDRERFAETIERRLLLLGRPDRVLDLLARTPGELAGIDIAGQIDELGRSSVYAALAALQRDGLVDARWDHSGSHPRRMLQISAAGRSVILDERAVLVPGLRAYVEESA